MTARGWAAPAASALIYTVITAILGRDVLAQLGSAIANDPGDPLLTAAILHWNAHHVPWSDAWWQFPIYYPTRDTLAFSEHLLGLSVVASPIAWLTGSPLVAYNLTTLLTFPLCGMAMYALMHRLTTSHAASFIAGLTFAFAPYRMSNLPHIQMLAFFWAPLALLGLHGFLDAVRFKRGRPWPWLALYGAAWALQVAANGYTLVFFSVLIGLWVVWFVVVPGMWRAVGMVAAATAAAAVPLLPIIYKYTTVHAYHGFERGLGEIRAYSADVAAVLCAPPSLTFWGWLRVGCRSEGELFPGVALTALFGGALIYVLSGQHVGRAVIWLRRVLLAVAAAYALIVATILMLGPWSINAGFIHISASEIDKPLLVALFAAMGVLLLSLAARAVRPQSMLAFYLFAAVATWSLALGPTITLMGEMSGRAGPFALLHVLPGVGGLRVPARFWLMTLLCLSTVAGIFVAEVLLRGRRRVGAGLSVALVACLALADGWTAPIAAAPVPSTVPNPGALRERIVLHVPMDQYTDIAATWRAALGGWRSINGYSGFEPNYYPAAMQASQSGSDVVFPPFRRDADLEVIVTDANHPIKAAVERQPGAIEVARRGGMIHYRLPQRASEGDVALGKALRVAAVRSRCAEEELLRTFDGDAGTVWLCDVKDGQELTVDLGEDVTVGGIDYAVGPYNQAFPDELVVETSTDGATWAAARRGPILREVILAGLRDSKSIRIPLPFARREARYVRIRAVAAPPDFDWYVGDVAITAP